MTRGYPDYYGQSIFPRLGVLQAAYVAPITCDWGGVTEILNLNGRMLFQSFELVFEEVRTPALISIYFYVDGVSMGGDNLALFYTYNRTEPHRSIAYVTVYSPAIERHVLQMTPNTTVYDNLTINIHNNDVIDCDVTQRYKYGLLVR